MNIDETAHRWLEKLSRGCSDEEYTAFDRWYARDEANRKAFERAKILQAQLDAIALNPAIKKLREQVAANTAHLSPNINESGRLGLVSGLIRAIGDLASLLVRSFESTYTRVATVASLVGAVLVSGYLLLTPERVDINTYVTHRGEQKSITLTDGSTATMDTDTVIKVSYSKNDRKIDLLRGRSFFDVKRDQERPFVVNTKSGQVKVVGTVFSVEQDDSLLVVTLKEGAVEVTAGEATSPDNNKPRTERLGPGERLSYSPASGVSRVQLSQLDKEFQWVSGNLVFDAARLEDVVTQISRYTDRQITLSDASLRDVKINAVFHVGELESFMKALTITLDIDVIRNENGDYELKVLEQPTE